MGGLPRRATVLAKERSAGPVIVVDGGDSLSVREPTRDLAVARLKAETIAASWAATGIDGLALSARDWTLGPQAVRAMAQEHGLPVLAANLTCGGAAPFEGHRVVERDGRRIGLIGVTAGSIDGCTITEPGPALAAAAASLGEVDLVVALLPLDHGELRGLDAVPADIAVVAGSAGRLDLGGAVPVAPMRRGKKLGLGRLAWVDGADGVWSADHRRQLKAEVDRREERLATAERRGQEGSAQTRFHAERLDEARAALAAYGEGSGRHRLDVVEVDLDDEVADDPTERARVDATLARIEAGLPEAATTVARSIPAGPYLGAAGCQGCHPAEHAQWSGTAHARAYAGLVADQHGQDPACVGCHVTAWRQTGGPQEVAAIGAFRDVQCETCHGPGRDHAADPASHDLLPGGDLEGCRTCHDGEQDMGRFDAATYLPRVSHGG